MLIWPHGSATIISYSFLCTQGDPLSFSGRILSKILFLYKSRHHGILAWDLSFWLFLFWLHILFSKPAGQQFWGQLDATQFISVNMEPQDIREGACWVLKSPWKFIKLLTTTVTQQGLCTLFTIFRKSNWQHQKNYKLGIWSKWPPVAIVHLPCNERKTGKSLAKV